jgi:hypothetical protein
MRILALSANLGGYDKPKSWPEQKLDSGVELDIIRLTDETFPPRPLAMTSRLQCGIPKMFGWQLYPGYDAYIWIDSSCILTNEYSVMGFVGKLFNDDIAVFKHPDRNSISEEYHFMKARMERPGETYLNSRYKGEWIDEQYKFLMDDPTFEDNNLFASTAFIYRPSNKIKWSFEEWWALKCRYLLHDQLAFPWVLSFTGVEMNIIKLDYRDCELTTYVRNKK